MTDSVPSGPALDHVKVSTLLRIIHDTVNMPGMEAIRDAANAELVALSQPLIAAKTKAVADAKAKQAAITADAAAKHKSFHPDTARNLTALKMAEHDAMMAAEKNPTAANIAAHEAAEKAYADALKAAEAAANPPKAIPANQIPNPTMGDASKRI